MAEIIPNTQARNQNAASYMGGMQTPQQAYILNAFRSQTYIQDQLDVQDEPIYDTIDVAVSVALDSSNNKFFSNLNLASGAAKGLWKTNMTQSKRLTAPEALSIFQYRLYFAPDILLADLQSLMENFVFQFWIGQKPYQTCPLWMLPQGGGIFGVSTDSAINVWANGFQTKEAARTLGITLVIESDATFYGVLVGDSYTLTAAASGGTGLTVVCALCGLHARGIQ